QREAKLSVFHPEGRLPWRVTRYLSIRRIEGEKGRVGEWESGRVGEGHKEKAILSVCLHGESRSGRGTPREAELSVRQPQGAERVGEAHKEKAILSVCLKEPRETRGDPRPPQKCIKIGQNEVRQPHGAQVFFRSEPKSTFLGLSRFRAVTPR